MISYSRLLMFLIALTYWGAVHAQTLTITAVTPNPVCAGSAITVAYEFTDNVPAILKLLLYQSGTSPVVLASTVTNGGGGSLQGTIPTDLRTGSYSVGLQFTVNGSTTSSPSSTLTINQLPVAPTTTAVNVCQNSTPVSLATGVTSGTNLRWYMNESEGTPSTVALSPSTTTPGVNTYYVSQTDGNGCESGRAAVTFQVKERPQAPTVNPNPIKYCKNEPAAPLTATTAQNGTLNFYTSSSGGTRFSSLIPSTLGSNNYYISQSADGCEGPRTTVAVIINDLPSVTITGLENTYCQDATTVTLSGSPTGGSFFVNNTQATEFTPASLSTGQHTVSYSYTDQLGCSNTADREITIYPSGGGQWLGEADTDWNNTANWSCGLLPTTTTNVVIPVARFMPKISGSGAICHNLMVASGASLTISTQLDIKGNLLNNGILQVPGTILFSGDAQVIPSGTYGSVFVRGTGIKRLGGNVTISGTLSFTSSHLQLDSYDLLIGNTGNISGFSKNGFVITNGTGRLKKGGIGNTGDPGAVTFPVGTSLASYTPLVLKNMGTDDVFGVKVIAGVYSDYSADDNPSGLALTQFSVNKTWLVSEQTQGGSLATLTFEWNEADEQPGFFRNNCFVAHYYNGRWHQTPTAPTEQVEPYSISITGVTSFSPFGVGSAGSALPLKLLTFTANPNSENVSLRWHTTYEFATSGFDIEASSDAVHFSKIGSIASSNNNTAEVSKYHLVVPYLTTGVRSYYRLKILDQDGTFSYSKILGVPNPKAGDSNYQIFPNPVTGPYLTVKAATALPGAVEVSIYDVSGSLMYQTREDARVFSSEQLKIPTENLSPGHNYILKIDEMATGISHSFKFFKM